MSVCAKASSNEEALNFHVYLETAKDSVIKLRGDLLKTCEWLERNQKPLDRGTGPTFEDEDILEGMRIRNSLRSLDSILQDRGDEVSEAIRSLQLQEEAVARRNRGSYNQDHWLCDLIEKSKALTSPVEERSAQLLDMDPVISRAHRDLGPAAQDPRCIQEASRSISICPRVGITTRNAQMFMLVEHKRHTSGKVELISIHDGMTRYHLGVASKDTDLGILVSTSVKAALASAVSAAYLSRRDTCKLAVVKVLASGKGYRQGPVLSFHTVVPLSIVYGPY
ncbi:hypothetical protein CEUSTIGMA_g5655.t1 [Chlamydomonas eustigma]|uniref:Uncharacterized protein n=1 Tax=Chlamydomonas eustigma TaxID=1157962 RepID=A0A250X565_9CHLO|nr:hypothetical protein CEUSTIGMA_g5655.t1 [Chlamydomonas eustigma]|eukprot:GAX78213.1 hypothetical protein CEUSTIGMA_g5655.t1 [Chlamydomonas eustigma]